MTTHPINSVGGLLNSDNVPKADLVSYEKTYVPLRLADAAALRAIDLTGSWLVFIAGLAYTQDTSDTTATDDGAWVIRDGGSNVWKKTPQLNSFDAYGAAADLSSFDAEAAGFTYFALDTYGFYVRLTATPGNWSTFVPFRGPRGGDVYDIAVWDNNRPSSGEILYEFTFTRSVIFEAGLTTSRGYSREPAAADATFSFQRGRIVTVTIASPGVFTWVAHQMANGTEVTLKTSGALPTGLAVDTIYYVVNQTADTFQLAATLGGTAIDTSGSQSGKHVARYEWGTSTYLAGDIEATYAAASATTFAAGDVLTVVGPDPRDDTLSGVHGTLAGTRN